MGRPGHFTKKDEDLEQLWREEAQKLRRFALVASVIATCLVFQASYQLYKRFHKEPPSIKAVEKE